MGDEDEGQSAPKLGYVRFETTRIKNPYAPRDSGEPPDTPVRYASDPPVWIAHPTDESHVHHQGILSHLLQAIGLGLGAYAAFQLAQPPSVVNPPSSSIMLVLPNPAGREAENPTTAEGDAAKAIRQVAQMVFEHLLDSSIDQAYEALALLYNELWQHKQQKKPISPEELQELNRLAQPGQDSDGGEIAPVPGAQAFQIVWKLLKPVLCDEHVKEILPEGGKQFGATAIKFLQDAGVLSKTISCLAPIVGAALAVAEKKTLVACCGGAE